MGVVATTDKVWSTTVRTLEGYRCAMCGRSRAQGWKTYAHHILAKGKYPAQRYLPENGVCLCWRCHKCNDDAPHVSPTMFDAWLEENRPEQWAWAEAEKVKPPGKKPKPRDHPAIRKDLRDIAKKERDYRWLCRTLGVAATEAQRKNDD